MADFFYKLYRTISSRKRVGFFCLILLVLGLVFLASKIEFEEDITKLIPTTEKNKSAQRVLQTVNFADKIIVNIKRDGGSIEDLTDYATQFIDSLNTKCSAYFTNIQGQVAEEDVSSTLNFIYNHLPLLLDDTDYKIIENKLQTDSISEITRNNYKTLISPSGIIAKETILKDPLGLSFIALKKLQQLTFGDDFSLQNGFLLSKDQNHILLFITPTHKSSETSENAQFVEQLYTLQDQLNSEYAEHVSSEYFGAALIAVANAKQIKRDIQLTVTIAMSILLIILILFYKKISLPVILFIPTVIGGLLAVAILFLIRTKISAISLGIGSVLLGVTLDYSLHVLTHIRSNSDIKSLFQEITKPILMSSLTTALAFLCLLFLKSQALQDLGIFAAVSVLGASSFALIFIPQVYKVKNTIISKKTPIDRFAAIPWHTKKWVVISIVVLFCVSLFTYNKVSFNNDLSKLNYEPPALMAAQKRLDNLMSLSSKSVYIASYSEDQDEAVSNNDSIYTTLNNLKDNSEIIDFSSIGSLLQSKEQQSKKIINWETFWDANKINTLKANLIQSGSQVGFKPKTFNGFYEYLDSSFNPLEISDFKSLPVVNMDDYISFGKDFTTITTLVKVDNEKTNALIKSFKDNPNTLVIDRKQMNETFLGNLKHDFNRLVLYSLIVVLLILFVFYRSLSLTLVTSIPIALTWLITIGVMGLFSIEFNIFNIIISSFIFGLGIDYSIFITNGLLHEYKNGEKVLPTHKTSIFLSVITTVLGVGVLIFAKHPALYTISLVCIIGIVSALLMSFTIQPVLFNLFIGSKTKRPISLRLLIHSTISFIYFGLGGFILSVLSVLFIKLVPISKKTKMKWFHKTVSAFMKSVLYSNPFVKKEVINLNANTFKEPSIIIANHTSFLDILAIGMLHPKIIFLVNDWVYNSPVFGKAVQAAGFYPVSSGIENGVNHLKTKVEQGYTLMVFPEGTRSFTNKIKRFHKGAFYLAEQLHLNIVPILIHGNSEVLPKGSFVIRDGRVTVKILPSIPISNLNFGTTYKERTKQISTYFKSEFQSLRNEIENETYFHSTVLEEFRYKSDALYKQVKHDLIRKKSDYKTIMQLIGQSETIVHLSKDCGQLDFLLSLDGPDRKLFSYIKDATTRAILKNSFISNTFYKISYLDTLDGVEFPLNNSVIIDANLLKDFDANIFKNRRIERIYLYNTSDIDKSHIEGIFQLKAVTYSNTLTGLKKE